MRRLLPCEGVHTKEEKVEPNWTALQNKYTAVLIPGKHFKVNARQMFDSLTEEGEVFLLALDESGTKVKGSIHKGSIKGQRPNPINRVF